MALCTSLQASGKTFLLGLSRTQLDAMPAAAGIRMHQVLVRLLQRQAAQHASSSAQTFPKDPLLQVSESPFGRLPST